MPELPDLTLYQEALQRFVLERRLERIQLFSPFVLRTVDPPLSLLEGKAPRLLRRVGKRIVLCFDGKLFLAIHLMIAGRFHWRAPGAKGLDKTTLAAFDFQNGTLLLTEASPKKRAAMYLVRGEDALRALDPGGLEPLEADLETFSAALRRENHTLKRALTDPRLLSGIGNAYSDEILHRARLSPVLLTQRLTSEQVNQLFDATQATLRDWIDRLREETGVKFPEKVTAFREGMAVHGRYGKPCPVCGSPVQRIVHAENESNYCAPCQTGGRLLADRALSKLLKEDWPRTLDELERRRAGL